METPLGLTYRPIFPVLHSIFKEAEQIRAQKQKLVDEANKVAEARIYEATKDAAVFHPKRQYVHALEDFFQTETNNYLGVVSKVRTKELPPQAIYDAQQKMLLNVDAANRYDDVTQAKMAQWDKSGNRNMQEIQSMYGTDTYDLTATRELGQATVLPPWAVDPNRFVNKVEGTSRTYNPGALTEKFIASLKKTEEDERAEYDALGNIASKTTSLPSVYFDEKLSPSAQQTLKMGAVNDPTSIKIMSRFMEQGPDYVNYLKLRTAEENPDFVTMTNDQKGEAMQKTLQKVFDEHGYIGKKTTERANKPPNPTDTSTKFNTKYIGGREDVEFRYMTEAAEYNKLFDPDPQIRKDALDMFYGKGVESVGLLKNGDMGVNGQPLKGSPNGYIRIKLDRQDPAYNPLMSMAPEGSSKDKEKGIIDIPLDPARLKSLSAYANLVRPQDLNPTYLRQALDKLRNVPEKPAGKPQGKKVIADF